MERGAGSGAEVLLEPRKHALELVEKTCAKVFVVLEGSIGSTVFFRGIGFGALRFGVWGLRLK